MPPLYQTDDDYMERACHQLYLERMRQHHPVHGTVGYYDDTFRVWCPDCKRSIDRPRDGSAVFYPCPYCRSEKIALLSDPLNTPSWLNINVNQVRDVKSLK